MHGKRRGGGRGERHYWWNKVPKKDGPPQPGRRRQARGGVEGEEGWRANTQMAHAQWMWEESGGKQG
eukprot:182166-Amphidinium_carterae.1